MFDESPSLRSLSGALPVFSTMKRFALLLCLASSVPLARAQGSGEFSLGLASQDIWRGTQVNDGLTFIPKMDFSLGTGTHLTVRGSIAMEGDGMDEWRYGIHHTIDLIAASVTFGATFFDREVTAGDTSEIWASAKMKWVLPFTFMAARDIDEVEGTYFRVSTGADIGVGIPVVNAGTSLAWEAWIGYADDDYAIYWGATEAGLADAGAKLTATFTLQQATVRAFVKYVTLVDDDFTTFTGDRSNIAVGASVGWRF
jgi:hypothetical protein